MSRTIAALILVLLSYGCGVKSDLEIPSGRLPPQEENDPSRPPQPLGQ